MTEIGIQDIRPLLTKEIKNLDKKEILKKLEESSLLLSIEFPKKIRKIMISIPRDNKNNEYITDDMNGIYKEYNNSKLCILEIIIFFEKENINNIFKKQLKCGQYKYSETISVEVNNDNEIINIKESPVYTGMIFFTLTPKDKITEEISEIINKDKFDNTRKEKIGLTQKQFKLYKNDKKLTIDNPIIKEEYINPILLPYLQEKLVGKKLKK
ncbi:MAG: hypothetical protein ACOCP8_05195 [archaeon]